jgi:two-component system, NarL family, invasion response regulator UvrY
MINVLITDDHPVVRRGIRQILEDDERIGIVQEASDGKALFEKLKEQLFDVILLDISLPGRSKASQLPFSASINLPYFNTLFVVL